MPRGVCGDIWQSEYIFSRVKIFREWNYLKEGGAPEKKFLELASTSLFSPPSILFEVTDKAKNFP